MRSKVAFDGSHSMLATLESIPGRTLNGVVI
jgi:hypothetical protein